MVPLEKSKQVVSVKATAVSGRETLAFCRVVYCFPCACMIARSVQVTFLNRTIKERGYRMF